jgi:hypothetical protein
MSEFPTPPAADRVEVAREIGTRFYGTRPSVRWMPSEEADVFILEFGGVPPPLPHKVVKLERPESWVVASPRRSRHTSS